MVVDRQLSDSEAIQIVKEYTEGSAQKQVDSFLDFNEHPTFEKLVRELFPVPIVFSIRHPSFSLKIKIILNSRSTSIWNIFL